MAQRKKNGFYMKRGKDGQETVYDTADKLLAQAYEYFDWCDKNPWKRKEAIKSGPKAGEIVDIPTERPYTVTGLCLYCGISEDTFASYETDANYTQVVTHIREIVKQNQLEWACVGAYSQHIVSGMLGTGDRQETAAVPPSPPELVINVSTANAKEGLERLIGKLSDE